MIPTTRSGAAGFAAERLRDARERERAGRAVDERDPVDEDARRERAEDEVLRGRLEGLRLALEVAGEDVLRERHELERDDDRHEVRPGRHEEHADGREEDEAVVLAARVRRRADEPQREEDRHDRREDQEDLEVEAEAVEDEHPAERRLRQRSGQPRRDDEEEARRDEGADRGEGDRALALAAAHGRREQQDESRRREEQLRQDEERVGGGERHGLLRSGDGGRRGSGGEPAGTPATRAAIRGADSGPAAGSARDGARSSRPTSPSSRRTASGRGRSRST